MITCKSLFTTGSMLLLLATSQTHATEPPMNLDQCIDRAVQSNLQLEIATEKHRESNSRVKGARSGFLPKISASGNYTILDEAPYMEFSPAPGIPSTQIALSNRNNINASVSASQPLFTGGKIWNSHKMAIQSRDATLWQKKAVQKDLIRDVTQTYYLVLASRRGLAALDSSIVLLKNLVNDLQNAFDVGMRPEHELLQVEVELLNQQLNRQQAQNGVDAAKGRLATMIGVSLSEPFELNDSIPEPADFDLPPLSELMRIARTDLPEIKSMENQLGMIQTSVNLSRAQNIPNLIAAASVSGKTEGVEELAWKDNWSMSLVLQWDIFDWGVAQQKRIQAQSQYKQMALGIEDMRNNMEYMVRTNYLSLKDAFSAIAISRKGVEQSRRAYQVTYDMFFQGLVPNSELLNAQNRSVQAELSYYRVLSDYHSRRADLEYLLSGNNDN